MAETRQPPESDPVSPPQKVLLTEQVLALRDILGYTDYVESSTTLASPTLRKGTRLPDSQMKDILLVAINVEVPGYYFLPNMRPDLLVHVGVSIIDTRQIQILARDAATEEASFENVIQNFQFAIGFSHNPYTAKKASKMFLFGESEPIDRAQLPGRLDELTFGRDFATVFHGTSVDFKVLQNLKVDLPARGIYILDTNEIAQAPLQLDYLLKLQNLCLNMRVPYALGPTAGNNAHHTLRALLMLAVTDAYRLLELHGCGVSENLLRAMRRIATNRKAMAPRPGTDLILRWGTKEVMKQQAGNWPRGRIKMRKAPREQWLYPGGHARILPKELEEGSTDLFEVKRRELLSFAHLPHSVKKEIRQQEREDRRARRGAERKQLFDANMNRLNQRLADFHF